MEKQNQGSEKNAVFAAEKLGQSLWLDLIDRKLVETNQLQKMVEETGIRGLTSNPAIFQKAMSESSLYDKQIQEELKDAELNAFELFERLAIRDIRHACDTFRKVYDEKNAADGFVSFEVAPWLAHDTETTTSEARRLWKEIARPNAMIKVPGTKEGVPAIRTLLSEGVNVNITLLFSRSAYEAVLEAYLSALEDRVKKNLPVDKVASVASFFVSRIDSAVDKKLEALAKSGIAEAKALEGKIAIDNAKLAYEIFQKSMASDRWKKLEAKGAKPQRLLWASTGTKNPAYSDVLYVEELIGPHTVNTAPQKTLEAFVDHGKAKDVLTQGIDQSHARLAKLEKLGISLDAITDELLTDAIDLFSEPFDQLLASLERKRRKFTPHSLNPARFGLGTTYFGKMGEAFGEWRKKGNSRRLWQGDASLWTKKDEAKWLDWLKLPQPSPELVQSLRALREEVHALNLKDAIVLGMGGSSLAPEVLSLAFEGVKGFPRLHVLDSTDPHQVKTVAEKIDFSRALFLVSSKSGSTLEPNLFLDYFWDRAKKALGSDEKAGQRFIAITDPGSQLEKEAKAKKFLHTFFSQPGVGGRYSALSPFGLVPAAVMGLDFELLLENARAMSTACNEDIPPEENPGVALGLVLGTLGKEGRDKITVLTDSKIGDFGAWLEQLIAESTGKLGKGIIPLAGETLGHPETYGDDRVFVHLSYGNAVDSAHEMALAALEEAGHPVIQIQVRDSYAVAQEFFRWEIATATAGAVLGINPFDQPDVEASKVETRNLTQAYEEKGSFPKEEPFFAANGVEVFTDEKNAKELREKLGSSFSLESVLGAHLSRAKSGKDYVALLAYLERSHENEAILGKVREEIRADLRVATCLGFGPRFLHSTGQAYKGGPNTGVFLQITGAVKEDLPVPGRKYGFGIVETAQARGDLDVLAQRGRRLLRLHIPAGHAEGKQALEKLQGLISSALRVCNSPEKKGPSA